MTIAENAVKLLKEKNATCVLAKGEKAVYSFDRGITPLLALIESGNDFGGYSAADTIVGRAAALMYIKLNVKELYAAVLSKAAKRLLESAQIKVGCDTLADMIINRKGDGACPMDRAVEGITDTDEAYSALTLAAAHLPKAELFSN